jgi:hypothetical protein
VGKERGELPRARATLGANRWGGPEAAPSIGDNARSEMLPSSP